MPDRPPTRRPERRGAPPVLIIVPSLVSGTGLVLVIVGLLFDREIVRFTLVVLGMLLLWLDFFITMAVFRFTARSIDRRLRDIEERLRED